MNIGLEEEVFILEPTRPTLQSLYYMGKLLWKNPRYYYTHTATNFNRGPDLKFGLMSSVEVSTSICSSAEEVVADLSQRRKDLASTTTSYIVAIGSLVDQWAPRNIAGLHLHFSGFSNFDRVYSNLIHFLPLLALLTATSSMADGSYYGKSFRWAEGFAIGPLREDRYYRFQDVIISKRLGTLELRLFDSTWDLERIKLLLECCISIINCSQDFNGDLDTYNHLRLVAAKEGYTGPIKSLYKDLLDVIHIPENYFLSSPGDLLFDTFSHYGLEGTYNVLDNAYRTGMLLPGEKKHFYMDPMKILGGFLGYYLPKAPYNIMKVLKEW